MKALIRINRTPDDDEFDELMAQITRKIRNQLNRAPGCICTTPEGDDVVRDYNGNIIGSITVTK